MFGPLGFNEIIFILVLGFLMLGPKQMALFSRTLGEVMGKLYRATADARRLFEEERRKLEEEMSDVTTPVREAKQQWGQLKGQLKKGVDGIDQEIRKERQAFHEHVEGVKTEGQETADPSSIEAAKDSESSDDGEIPDLSRRKFLGDFDPPEGEASSGKSEDSDASDAPAPIEVRTPSGQMARGTFVDDPPGVNETETTTEGATAADEVTAEDAPEPKAVSS